MRFSKALPFLILALLIVGSASALQITNVFSPINGATVTSSRIVNFKFSIDKDVTGCWLGVTLSNNTPLNNTYSTGSTNGGGNITASLLSGRTYNRSFVLPVDSALQASNNWTVYCGNSTSDNLNLGTMNFNLYTYTPIAAVPANNTISNSKNVPLSMTTGVAQNIDGLTNSTTTCQYQVWNPDGLISDWRNMTNTSIPRTAFANGSQFPPGEFINDTAFGKFVNITYRCNESNSVSWNSHKVWLTVDSTPPGLTGFANATTYGSVATFYGNFTDNNSASCRGLIYNYTGNLMSTKSGYISSNVQSPSCLINVTGSDIGYQGNFYIVYNVTDLANNTARNLQNQTGIVIPLVAGWNLISYPGLNKSMTEVCAMVTNCSSVSYFNNTLQAYKTWTSSANTVNNYTMEPGFPIYMYVSGTDWLVTSPNYPGIKSPKSLINFTFNAWNTFGLQYNASFQSALNAVSADLGTRNVTAMSYYNATGATYITCYRNSSLCAGTTNAGGINLPPGSAVWALPDNNSATLSVNISLVTG